MNKVYIELCMGHALPGVKGSYFKPQPDSDGIYRDLLEGHDKSPGYLDSIEWLTINNEMLRNIKLQRENEMLKVRKSDYEALKEDLERFKEGHDQFKKAFFGLMWQNHLEISETPEGRALMEECKKKTEKDGWVPA